MVKSLVHQAEPLSNWTLDAITTVPSIQLGSLRVGVMTTIYKLVVLPLDNFLKYQFKVATPVVLTPALSDRTEPSCAGDQTTMVKPPLRRDNLFLLVREGITAAV